MVYALTCGLHQQPIQAKQLSKNRQSPKYKQRKRKLCKGGDYALNKMDSKDKILTLSNLMEIPWLDLLPLPQMSVVMKVQPRS